MCMKKAISAFLVAVMIISLVPGGALQVNAATYGDLTYTVVNEEVAITRCSQFASGSIHIPSELEGYPVTRIYGDAFINCTKVTHIYIPSTVVKIETGAFAWISNLQGIYVDENNHNYCADNGVLFNKDKTILLRAPRTLTEYIVPSSVIQIGSSAFNGCKNLNNVIIGDNVTSIGSSAFYECASLVSITIPDSVKTIEGSAFYRCTNLSDVEFGNSLTTIGEYAFNYCYALTSISLPDSVTDINRAFNQCTSLTSIDIGNVKTLDYRAFWGCSKLASITIGSNFTRVGSDAFEGCESLINVYYYGTEEQWQKVTISDGNFYLTERATVHYVHDCQWDEGTVTKEPSCVPGIKTYTCTWPGCGKTMTESIEKISDHKYGLWTSIDGKTHQRTCTCGDVETGNHNWDKNICTEIRTCTNCGETSQGHIWTEATCNAPKTCIICNSTEGNPVHNVVGEVCSGCGHYGTCGENLIWSLDDAGVLTISGTGAMSDYNYNTIPWYSIKNTIKSIVLSNGVSSIGDNAFYECLKLTSVSIPATVTSIGEWAFYFCRSLTGINLPNGITTIDKYAFRYCMNVVNITLPDSVSTIGNGAFSYCSALESINIPDAVTAINQSTFADSRNLKNITIGKGVTKIWSSAFENCSSLESINIPTTVNMIQSSAFKGCSKLTTVIYCGTTTQWEAIQFINSNSILLGCERIQHSWIDATCVAPKTCAYCGVTDGDVIEHIYDNACDSTCNTCEKTRIPADHVYDNVCDTSCNICGAVRTVTHSYGDWIKVDDNTHQRTCPCGNIDTADHRWDDGIETIPATGTTPGTRTHTCIDCSAIKEAIIPKVTYKLSGELTSFGASEDSETILHLFVNGETEPTYEIGVPGTGSKEYSFSDLPVGIYTLRVIKTNHRTTEYEITITDADVTQNIAIWLYGDATSDGVVDTLDRMAVSRYLANWEDYSESFINLVVADVNGDGVVDTLDRMILNRYLANWDGYESLDILSIQQ